MKRQLQESNTLYPLLSIIIVLVTFIISLITAHMGFSGIFFLVAVYILFCLFGYIRICIKLIAFLVVYLSIFYVIFFFSSGKNTLFAAQMIVRLAGVFIAAIPGITLAPVKLVRNLTQLKCPRLISLGMLITLTFIPLLASEIKTIKNAMKTRGVTSPLNPAIFYRAFLIPLIVRLVNISDTLALSVETRGFVSDKNNFTVYNADEFTVRDFIFIILYLAIFGISLCMQFK
ncbi:MAG: energy-coupling factor transporter transmembrane protein EcfT [Treponema sp.]|nr:energy-coupling factor transporter transmembrane protein EcfT [Treponema sp.]